MTRLQTLADDAAAASWLRAHVRGDLAGDHRLLRAGDGLLAWPGLAHDARRFVPAALAAGAAACLVEAERVASFGFDDARIAALPQLKRRSGPIAAAFYGHPSARLTVVAATGTNGKTSTTWWLAQALGRLGRRCAVVGTLGVGEPPHAAGAPAATGHPAGAPAATGPPAGAPAATGHPAGAPDATGHPAATGHPVATAAAPSSAAAAPTAHLPPAGMPAVHASAAGTPPAPAHPAGAPSALLQATGLTTPDAVMLQRQVHALAAAGVDAIALEASSIGLAEHRLDGLSIDVALFTNFSQDHLDYHGTMADYWAAKRRLFGWPGLKAAVINLDDAHGAALAEELRVGGPELWTCSMRREARLHAANLHHDADGLAFELSVGQVRVPVRTRLVGGFNASNLLLVIGALRALHVPLEEALHAVAQLQPVPGRMQRVASGAAGEPEVVVDYAHSPDALEQVLQALKPMARARGGRLWCVFGCGGNRDSTKRPLMGAIAARHAQRVVLTSDNPRDEAPDFILAQILAGAILVLTVQDAFWRGVHVAVSTAVWAGFVALAMIAHLRSAPSPAPAESRERTGPATVS